MTQELTQAPSSRVDSLAYETSAWSATGSSLQTLHKLDSVLSGKSSFDGSGCMTIDNVSKMSFDSQPVSNLTGMTVATAQKSSQHERSQKAVASQPTQVHGASHMQSPNKVKGKGKGWKKIAAWFEK